MQPLFQRAEHIRRACIHCRDATDLIFGEDFANLTLATSENYDTNDWKTGATTAWCGGVSGFKSPSK